MRLVSLSLGILVAFLPSARAQESDWPGFLGPLGTSVSTEKGLAPWPKEGPRVVWHQALGTGYGAPVLSASYAICPDARYGFSRAGQSYVAQNVYVDATGATWYEIYYNHRLAWVPGSEVAAR